MGGTRIRTPDLEREEALGHAPAPTFSDEQIYAPLAEHARDPAAEQIDAYFAPLYAQLDACARRYAVYDANSRQAFALYHAVLVELEVAARTHTPVDLDGLRRRARRWQWHGEAMWWMHVAADGERPFFETGPFAGALVNGHDPTQLFRAAVRDTDEVDDRPALDSGGDGVNRYMEADGWVGTRAEVDDRRFGAAVDAMDDVKSLGGAVAYGVSGLWTDDAQQRIQWAGLGNTAGNVLGTAAMPFGARLGPGEAPPEREAAALEVPRSELGHERVAPEQPGIGETAIVGSHGPGAASVHDESFAANRRYEASPKHASTSRQVGGMEISPKPTNGQAALDLSFPTTKARRIGVDVENNEFVVLDRTGNLIRDKRVVGGVYHGHVRAWEDLGATAKNALQDRQLVDNRGRITLDPKRWDRDP